MEQDAFPMLHVHIKLIDKKQDEIFCGDMVGVMINEGERDGQCVTRKVPVDKGLSVTGHF